MSIPTDPLALRVYQALGGFRALGYYGAFVEDDPANDYAVAKIIAANMRAGEDAYKAFLDGSWLDPENCPDSFVMWLASKEGVDPRGADLETLRRWIPTGGPTRQRGSDDAIKLRVEQVLTGSKAMRFYPRTDPAHPGVDSPGHTLIRTRSSETPGGVDSVVMAAYDRAAASWQIVHAQVLTGSAWDEMTGSWNDATGTWEDN